MLVVVRIPSRTARALAFAVMGGLAHAASPAAFAQSSLGDVSASARLWRWTPLQPIGDLGMPTPQLTEFPRLLDTPALRVGIPRISANPARLPDEIDSSWTQVVLSTHAVSGSYHAPLEPTDVSSRGISLAGWTRVGARTAAIGRVAVASEALRSGTYSAFATPSVSSPFAPADTNRPALAQTLVTLEGAEGISLGVWRLGIAAGYHATERGSTQSTAAQIGRASSTGLSLGAARALGANSTAGFYARELQSSETVNLIANPQTIRVFMVDGFVNAQSADYSVAVPPFLRRADRAASALGTDISGRAVGGSWEVYLERQSLAEHQISELLSPNPATDHWRSSGIALGSSVQSTMLGLLATVRADWTSQRGEADRAGTTTGAYRSDASRLTLAGDIGFSSADSGWMVASTLSLGRDAQAATDDAARASTDIVAWMPGLSLEVGRRVSDKLTVALSYGRFQFTPYADIPSPDNRGKGYTLLVAPAIELASATARADQFGATGRWRAGSGSLSMRVWASSMRPLSRPVTYLPLPLGNRAAWGLTMSAEPAR